MSVIVKGMEMPECCADCFAISESLGWCKVTGNEIFNPFPKDRLPSFCPLRPLPEKHGRLIDADELEKVSAERLGVINIGHIDKAPTIVEAEGYLDDNKHKI